MSRRVETRSLGLRIADLDHELHRLFDRERRLAMVAGTHHVPTTTRHAAHLKRIIRGEGALADVLRRLSPRDVRWEEHDIAVSRLPDASMRERFAGVHLMLHGLLDIEARMPRSAGLDQDALETLTFQMIFPSDRQRRTGARAVLADMIEESGRLGEANALRLGLWPADRAVLNNLGVPVAMPAHAYDHLGRAI